VGAVLGLEETPAASVRRGAVSMGATTGPGGGKLAGGGRTVRFADDASGAVVEIPVTGSSLDTVAILGDTLPDLYRGADAAVYRRVQAETAGMLAGHTRAEVIAAGGGVAGNEVFSFEGTLRAASADGGRRPRSFYDALTGTSKPVAQVDGTMRAVGHTTKSRGIANPTLYGDDTRRVLQPDAYMGMAAGVADNGSAGLTTRGAPTSILEGGTRTFVRGKELNPEIARPRDFDIVTGRASIALRSGFRNTRGGNGGSIGRGNASSQVGGPIC
jgi:hypothetical protein